MKHVGVGFFIILHPKKRSTEAISNLFFKHFISMEHRCVTPFYVIPIWHSPLHQSTFYISALLKLKSDAHNNFNCNISLKLKNENFSCKQLKLTFKIIAMLQSVKFIKLLINLKIKGCYSPSGDRGKILWLKKFDHLIFYGIIPVNFTVSQSFCDNKLNIRKAFFFHQ